MALQLNRAAYLQLLEEDIQWLEAQPRSLERDHIIELLRFEMEYLLLKRQANEMARTEPQP